MTHLAILELFLWHHGRIHTDSFQNCNGIRTPTGDPIWWSSFKGVIISEIIAMTSAAQPYGFTKGQPKGQEAAFNIKAKYLPKIWTNRGLISEVYGRL